jgi:hypothetical protein
MPHLLLDLRMWSKWMARARLPTTSYFSAGWQKWPQTELGIEEVNIS